MANGKELVYCIEQIFGQIFGIEQILEPFLAERPYNFESSAENIF